MGRKGASFATRDMAQQIPQHICVICVVKTLSCVSVQNAHLLEAFRPSSMVCFMRSRFSWVSVPSLSAKLVYLVVQYSTCFDACGNEKSTDHTKSIIKRQMDKDSHLLVPFFSSQLFHLCTQEFVAVCVCLLQMRGNTFTSCLV